MRQPKCAGGRAWSPCDAGGGCRRRPIGLALARRGASSRLLATVPSGLTSKAGDLELRQHFLLNDGAYTIQGLAWRRQLCPGADQRKRRSVEPFGPTNDLLSRSR
jgi:hypothetical protein